jgi:hypothetical protein
MTYNTREISVADAQPFELYLFETADDTFRITSGDIVRSYLGHDYEPTPITRTETKRSGEEKAANITVNIPRDHPISALFRSYMPATPLSLVIYRGHDADTEIVTHFTGRVTICNYTTNSLELTCAPEEDLLRRKIPFNVFQTPCNKILYSATCGILADDFKVIGTLTYVNGAELRSAEFNPANFGGVTGWLRNGYVEVGNTRRMIIDHTGEAVILITPLPMTLIIGDSINAFAGCSRNYNDPNGCVPKFANGPRFLGFDKIPGRNPFKGLLY